MDFPLEDMDPATRSPVARTRGDQPSLVSITPTFYIDPRSIIAAEFRSNGVLEIQYRVGSESESMLFFGDQAALAWERFQLACARYLP
jgi:hypothetical protein